MMLLMTMAARAQTGCLDSPENPTAVLGLVGGAAAALFWRRKFPPR
jgi:XrtJ-associated TM-motif-TM protein